LRISPKRKPAKRGARSGLVNEKGPTHAKRIDPRSIQNVYAKKKPLSAAWCFFKDSFGLLIRKGART
jgi:hypothetical protein